MTTRESLDALAAEAGSIGAEPDAQASGQVPDGGPVATVQDDPNVGAVAFMPAASREVLCAVLGVQSPRTTLADEHIERMAGPLAAVATKYGLQLSSAFNGPEAQAVMVAGPILWTAYRELARELDSKARAARKPQEPKPDPQPAPGPEASA